MSQRAFPADDQTPRSESPSSAKAVFLTAGAAGMYCGSCMHDNALAKALRQQGVDCVLQPVYTPIRTDTESVADQHVFFGGIHIYLLQQFPRLRFVPKPFRRMLDWAPLIRFATRRTHSADPQQLAELTISMLKGSEGRQAAEVDRLVHWLADELQPQAVLLSNLLIGGALPVIRRRLPQSRLAVLLQGDDIFLDHLPEPKRDEAIHLCHGLAEHVDHFITHSRFYADKMSVMLSLPRDKFVVTPLSIDTAPFQDTQSPPIEKQHEGSFRLGYCARIAPEKGLHHLVDTFIRLARDQRHSDLTLHVAGWLGEANRSYLEQQQQKIADASLSDRFQYHGSPSLEEKVHFLRSLDLLCVPTEYEEPKGLFVLEALAAGVAVVQPDHGAFGELIESTGGGLVVRPGSIEALGEAIERLKDDTTLRQSLAEKGHAQVLAKHTIEKAAEEMKQILFG